MASPARSAIGQRTSVSGEDAPYEVVRGHRVELPPMSAYSSWVANRLFVQLFAFGETHRLGTVVEEALMIFDRAADFRRRPDVAFVSAERWPLNREIPEEGDWAIIPDLAVEVVSPNDLFSNVLDKVREYFHFGVKQVWVINPPARQVLLFESETQVRILTESSELLGEPLLPGFRLPLAPLFRRTSGPAQT